MLAHDASHLTSSVLDIGSYTWGALIANTTVEYILLNSRKLKIGKDSGIKMYFNRLLWQKTGVPVPLIYESTLSPSLCILDCLF